MEGNFICHIVYLGKLWNVDGGCDGLLKQNPRFTVRVGLHLMGQPDVVGSGVAMLRVPVR